MLPHVFLKLERFLIIFKATAFGFLVAMPVGPIGLLCISRTLASGLAAGLATGLGVALADGVYAGLVALGAAAFAATLTAHAAALQVAGGLALAAIGLHGILGAAKRPSPPGAPARRALFAAAASAFALTMANPATIASFAAIATALGVDSIAARWHDAAVFAVGLFLGSLAWWVLLSAGVAAARQRAPASGVAWLNRISGALLGSAGLYLAGRGAGLV